MNRNRESKANNALKELEDIGKNLQNQMDNLMNEFNNNIKDVDPLVKNSLMTLIDKAKSGNFDHDLAMKISKDYQKQQQHAEGSRSK